MEIKKVGKNVYSIYLTGKVAEVAVLSDIHWDNPKCDRKLLKKHLEYCKENYLEPEDVAKLINKSLKDKIEMNFRDLNYLPKQAQLDV